eukprot:SRR837773.4297.p1 GENE.SRR837773.4297~~SRR837773.4297.p1  ORF type:complete len:214 (-),score=12.88 SRR837773.4297:4-645(-)
MCQSSSVVRLHGTRIDLESQPAVRQHLIPFLLLALACRQVQETRHFNRFNSPLFLLVVSEGVVKLQQGLAVLNCRQTVVVFPVVLVALLTEAICGLDFLLGALLVNAPLLLVVLRATANRSPAIRTVLVIQSAPLCRFLLLPLVDLLLLLPVELLHRLLVLLVVDLSHGPARIVFLRRPLLPASACSDPSPAASCRCTLPQVSAPGCRQPRRL